MAEQVEFELVTPARLLVSETVEMVVIPGGEGDFGVLPGHTPMMSTIRPGLIDIHENGRVARSIFVDGGFAEVTPVRVTVLAEEAMSLDDISMDAAERRLQKANDALVDTDDPVLRRQAERELAIAEAMQAALERG